MMNHVPEEWVNEVTELLSQGEHITHCTVARKRGFDNRLTFVAWTSKHVIFTVESDRNQRVTRVPRSPMEFMTCRLCKRNFFTLNEEGFCKSCEKRVSLNET